MAAVLPDLDRLGNIYVRMAFDGEPTADHDRLASLPPDSVKRLAGELQILATVMNSSSSKPSMSRSCADMGFSAA